VGIEWRREGGSIFFEKKKQKTFVPMERAGPVSVPPQIDKVFLLLFVHKKKTSPRFNLLISLVIPN